MDIAAFYNDYSRLRSTNTEVSNVGGTYPNNLFLQQNINLANTASGNTYGVELATTWPLLDWWRWDTNCTVFCKRIPLVAFFRLVPSIKIVIKPQYITPAKDVNLDIWFRYTGSATTVSVPVALNSVAQVNEINAYLTMDMRLSWKPHAAWEISVTGQNLLNAYHLEYVAETLQLPTQISRGVYGKVTCQF